jgi:hypothetical protein
MQAWNLITLLDPQIVPEETKIHLAGWNGSEDPLDLYRAGTFDEWQAWQSRKNFEKRYVLALIEMPSPHKWLFAGAYEQQGRQPENDGYRYDLAERPAFRDIAGRLIVHFERPGRQPYLHARSHVDKLVVSEIRAKRLSVPEFPGFKGLHISKGTLDLIVRENDASWRNPLSSVAGVYLISDSISGKFYVGSATGEGGIWQRWCDYSRSGHGDNTELKELLKAAGMARAAGFQYSVLEIADTHASRTEVLGRESHWKRVLLTRIHGLNPR